MEEKKARVTALAPEIRFNAMVLAYIAGSSFTVQAFCSRYSFKVNRYSRRVLNDMVKDGFLVKHKTLYDDGHYRMVYSAQPGPRLAGS